MTFKQWLTFSFLCILQGTPKPKLPMVLRPTKSAQTSVSLCLPHFLVCICSLFLNFIKSKICLWVFLFLIWLVFGLIFFKRKIGELIFFQDTLYLIHKNIQEDFSAHIYLAGNDVIDVLSIQLGNFLIVSLFNLKGNLCR